VTAPVVRAKYTGALQVPPDHHLDEGYKMSLDVFGDKELLVEIFPDLAQPQPPIGTALRCMAVRHYKSVSDDREWTVGILSKYNDQNPGEYRRWGSFQAPSTILQQYANECR